MSNRTPEIIQHFVHAEACPWVLPALAKLGPRLGRDGFCGFEKRGRFIELKHVAGFEIEPGTNAYRNGDLAFGGKRCAHGLKVRQKRKELKEGVPEGWMQTVRSSATRRFCHPAGVRAPFGPVSGGGAARHTPANILRCLRHLPRFPEETVRLHQCLRHLGRRPRAVSGGNRAQLLTGTGF
jgi:hypothetical protein